MSLKLSNRSVIPEFRALEILRSVNERVTQGESIKRLEAGQPCFGAPEPALEYAKQLLTDNPIQGYTESMGLRPLRERISDYYKNLYNCTVNPDNIVITIGASGAFLLGFLAVFNAGDKVAIAAPGYPAYRNIFHALGIEVVEIETTEATNYQPYVSELEKLTDNIDGLLICSPSNPTGTIIPDEELKNIVDWCAKKNVRLIADELYQRVTYGTKAETALKHTNDALIVNSFSKYFALTGWRLGWMVMPDDVTPRVKALAESMFVSPPTLSQHVAYKTFEHMDILDGYVEKYKRNLEILQNELPKAGFTNLSNTQGAFYVYADIHHLTNNSESFCRRMIDEAGVSCTPGTDFDLTRGHSTMRISFAGSEQDIIEACQRLKDWQK